MLKPVVTTLTLVSCCLASCAVSPVVPPLLISPARAAKDDAREDVVWSSIRSLLPSDSPLFVPTGFARPGAEDDGFDHQDDEEEDGGILSCHTRGGLRQ